MKQMKMKMKNYEARCGAGTYYEVLDEANGRRLHVVCATFSNAHYDMTLGSTPCHHRHSSQEDD